MHLSLDDYFSTDGVDLKVVHSTYQDATLSGNSPTATHKLSGIP